MVINDTNVVVLAGDWAVSRFGQLVNRWSHLLPPGQWQGFQFLLAGTRMPSLAGQLEEGAAALVGDGNTRFYALSEPAPDGNEWFARVHDKVRSGQVRVHLVCDCAGEENVWPWVTGLMAAAAEADIWTTGCLYYLLFERMSPETERAGLTRLLDAYPGATFLLTDVNENGGRVTPEERWNAAMLAVLLCSAGAISAGWGAHSLGYSALNANGTELRRLRESAACRALLEELERPVNSLAELENPADWLPEGAESLQHLRDWLGREAERRVKSPAASALHNAWITVRMRGELAPAEALRRMRRFADMNYTGPAAEDAARAFAAGVEAQLMQRLRRRADTARLTEHALDEIAQAFGRLGAETAEPAACAYPPKPLGARLGLGSGRENWEKECRQAVWASVRQYLRARNVALFAGCLAESYRRLARWVAEGPRASGDARWLLQSLQRELAGEETGSMGRLKSKYRHYSQQLDRLHPHLGELTEGFSGGDFYTEQGCVEESTWRNLVTQAGQALRRKLPAEFRGDFFSVLSGEFATEEEREAFFDEYLKSGPRMFLHLNAQVSAGAGALLVDERLTGDWFTRHATQVLRVQTDNAENVTVYPLGGLSAADCLNDPRSPYFRGSADRAPQGRSLFGESGGAAETAGGRRRRSALWTDQAGNGAAGGGRSLWGTDTAGEAYAGAAGSGRNAGQTREAGSGAESGSAGSGWNNEGNREAGSGAEAGPAGDPAGGLRLEPDARGNYRLYWRWRGNDATARVELWQDGERVGRVAVIPVMRFKENGENMNVTDDVLGGRPMPAGWLTVSVRDAENEMYIPPVRVLGRRDLVRWQARGQRLTLKLEDPNVGRRLMLRTREADGQTTCYPLYPSDTGEAWAFEGLRLSDPKVMEDPQLRSGTVFVVNPDDSL